jgi:hypothetical protein
MRIYEEADYRAMCRRAANILSACVILEPDCVLGLATGSTPLGIYDQLAQWCARGDLSFAAVHTVNLDEYRGLAPQHPQSYRYFMQSHFFDRIDIDPANTELPDGFDFPVTCSIGIAFAPTGAADFGACFDLADRCLYRAKAGQKGGLCTGDAENAPPPASPR